MCGIVGYFDTTSSGFELPETLFDRMIDAMAHRGPDGRGRLQRPGLGLGHRRLAIIDVLDRAAQPMKAPGLDVHLIFNGEIYNFPDLRRELEALGHVFATTSDTEVLLHGYLEWDLACVERLNGIFAFAVHDGRRNRLWLVRDPLGVKPLFYADTGRVVAFASEVTPLLAMPSVDTRPDPRGIDAYFTFSYVPAPMTGYRGIRQILPGQHLLIESGRRAFTKYWDLPLSAPKLAGSEEELTAEFDRLLRESVKRQMISDVPLGGFLSSGTDSFAIVRAMTAARPGQTRAFSVGFTDVRFDELPWTARAAAALGVPLETRRMDLDMGSLCEEVAPHSREPFADSSALPTYQLCRMAAGHVKVALSGDGADEMLAGYATYPASTRARQYRRAPRWLRRSVLAPLARALPDTGGKYSLGETARRFVLGAEQGPWRDHASWRVVFHQVLKRLCYTSEFWNQVKDFDPIDLYAQPMRRAHEAGCETLDCLLYADQTFYLPNDMLVKVDRMSMAHGLEVRVPFLDKDLVEFCWRLPAAMKRRRRGKYILRRSIAEEYPAALARRPKSGFNMAYDAARPPRPRLENPFCRPITLEPGHTFGRYHRLMIEYLLKFLPT